MDTYMRRSGLDFGSMPYCTARMAIIRKDVMVIRAVLATPVPEPHPSETPTR